MKLWVIIHDKEKNIYSLSNKDISENDVIIKELGGELSYEDARHIYIQFLEQVFPINKHT